MTQKVPDKLRKFVYYLTTVSQVFIMPWIRWGSKKNEYFVRVAPL